MFAAVALVSLAPRFGILPTFAELEKEKYEEFAKLKDYKLRYDVFVTPPEGAGTKEECTLTFGESARKFVVVVNGQKVQASGVSTRQDWTVNYAIKAYSLGKGTGEKYPPYQALTAPPGQGNFEVSDRGVRIASDPPAVVVSSDDEAGDKPLTKVVAKAVNSDAGGELTATQWFDKGTAMVRKFEIVSAAHGEVKYTIRGFLRDDGPFQPQATDFDFPADDTVGFRKID